MAKGWMSKDPSEMTARQQRRMQCGKARWWSCSRAANRDA